MIKKSLICVIPEATDDVTDALSIRTTTNNTIIVDVLVDIKRFAININDLAEALQELREFNIGNEDEGHISSHVTEIMHIPELEVMSLDILEKKVDDELPF